MSRNFLIALLVGAGATAIAAPAPWEARYAALPALSAELIKRGAAPGWRITIGRGEDPEIRIEDDEKGSALGSGLVGRRFEPLDSRPRSCIISFEYKMQCSAAERSGAIMVMVVTEAAWARFSPEVGVREPMPALRSDQVVYRALIRQPMGADVTEWRAWSSGNIAPQVARHHGRPLYLVLGFTGYHLSGKESAAFRAIRFQASSEPPPPIVRRPQYPLKTARTLHTPEELAQAQQNVERFKKARDIRDGIVRRAEPWTALSDDELLARIPPASVPRAFNVSTEGCPVHGKAVYKHGTYPWILRADHPYQIECPVGGEKYPSNDFVAFLRSGFRDRSLLAGAHADDGWGWVSDQGERYWLVGYACHWHWQKFVLPAVTSLAQAYLLTGEVRFGHAGALMLATIAADYPNFDYATQSRFGLLNEGRYKGKIVNHIWETRVLRNLAAAYDHLWDFFDRDKELQRRFGKSGEQLRSMIEANLLEEGIEAVFDRRIQGNFGMHQEALATAAIVRQQGPVNEWLQTILTDTKRGAAYLGIEYALYNLVYREGMPSETSPGYCLLWPSSLGRMGELLEHGGVRLFDLPRMEGLLTAHLKLHVLDKFTPDLGDSGSVWGGIADSHPLMHQIAYRHYHNPASLAWLRRLKATGEAQFVSFDSLFHEPLADAGPPAPPLPPTRLLDGYGMVILGDDANSWAASLYYGYRGGHSHFDTLGFDLYANGQKMMPDLGYPDFMNAFVSGIYSWSKNTISHNCVTIDRRSQNGNGPGSVEFFGSHNGVHAVEVTAPSAYPGCGDYRRCLVLVDAGDGAQYAIDLFRVAGGKLHTYSVHGPPGESRIVGGQWTEPAPGTLAGPNVKVGALYDDPRLGAPGYHGSFTAYRGSGYSHFIQPQRLESGQWRCEYRHLKDESARLALRVLTTGDEKVTTALARVSPFKHPELVRYFLVERPAGEQATLFAGVFDPFASAPDVKAAHRQAVDGGVIITIEREGNTDTILYRDPAAKQLRGRSFTMTCRLAALIGRGAGRSARVALFGAGKLSGPGIEAALTPIVGEVLKLRPDKRQVLVRTAAKVAPQRLVGRYLTLRRGARRVWHPIADAATAPDGVLLNLADDILIGRTPLIEADRDSIQTGLRLFALPLYSGAVAVNESFSTWIPVNDAQGSVLHTAAPAPMEAFTDTDGNGVTDVWLCSFGPGARVEIEETHTPVE